MFVTYSELLSISFVSWVKLLDIIFRVLDDDFVRLTVKLEDYSNHVLFLVFQPPALED